MSWYKNQCMHVYLVGWIFLSCFQYGIWQGGFSPHYFFLLGWRPLSGFEQAQCRLLLGLPICWFCVPCRWPGSACYSSDWCTVWCDDGGIYDPTHSHLPYQVSWVVEEMKAYVTHTHKHKRNSFGLSNSFIRVRWLLFWQWAGQSNASVYHLSGFFVSWESSENQTRVLWDFSEV